MIQSLFDIRLQYREENPNKCTTCTDNCNCSEMLSSNSVQGKHYINSNLISIRDGIYHTRNF